jgi:nucleoside-diphosphate-sugar epimerase
MVVLASSTAVWREAAPGEPARFLDETTPTDDTDDYAWSKIACEALLAATELPHIILRLARFASQGAGEDDVRKLYRPVDPRDAASAVVAALDLAGPRSMYAIAAPTPFRSEDAALLGRDARAAIRARTGTEPVWAPAHIGSVVVSSRAQEELGWRCVYPSTLLRVN